MVESTRGSSSARPTAQAIHPEFTISTSGSAALFSLNATSVGLLDVARLEIEASLPSATAADPRPSLAYFQRTRGRLRALSLRLHSGHVATRIKQAQGLLAAWGISHLSVRFDDGFLACRARVTEGLNTAELAFRIHLLASGSLVRCVADSIGLYNHFPTVGPVLADRIIHALLGPDQLDAGTDVRRIVNPTVRGLCDLELDVVRDLLWHTVPARGFRLPKQNGVELTELRVERSGIYIAFGPLGSRGAAELGVRPAAFATAASHDLMHSADELLRQGDTDGAMRGYRALLSTTGPEQLRVIERIVALAPIKQAWYVDGIETARQTLARFPQFAAGHLALAIIALAGGDARAAASAYARYAELAALDGNDDGAALAALAGARIVRLIEPPTATHLYQLALEYDPGSIEAAEGMAERLADEQRWVELIKLWRARAVVAATASDAAQFRVRIAGVLLDELQDVEAARQELEQAFVHAGDAPAVHEMHARLLAATGERDAALAAWQKALAAAEAQGDKRALARVWEQLGEAQQGATSEYAWQKALEYDPFSHRALAGLAHAAFERKDYATAATRYERIRGLGLPFVVAARYELELARALIAADRIGDARTTLRRLAIGRSEIAGEAHAQLAALATSHLQPAHAEVNAIDFNNAMQALHELASEASPGLQAQLLARATRLALDRAAMLEAKGLLDAALRELHRAYDLAGRRESELAYEVALRLATHYRQRNEPSQEIEWLTCVLGGSLPESTRAEILVRRAELLMQQAPTSQPEFSPALDLDLAIGMLEAIGVHDGPIHAEALRLSAQLSARHASAPPPATVHAAATHTSTPLERIHQQLEKARGELAHGAPATCLETLEALVPDLAHLEPEAERRAARLERDELCGDAALALRQWDLAIHAFEQVLSDEYVGPTKRPMIMTRLALAAERKGDLGLAMATLWPLMAALPSATHLDHPLRISIARQYAELCEATGDLANAASALKQLAAEPTLTASARADAYFRAGEVFRKQPNTQAAQECFEEACALDPSHLGALDALELIYRETARPLDVVHTLERKLATLGKQPQRQLALLSRLIEAQLAADLPDAATATAARARDMAPHWRPALYQLAAHAAAQGQGPEALAQFAALCGALPGDRELPVADVELSQRRAELALLELITHLSAVDLDGLQAALAALPDELKARLPRPPASGVPSSELEDDISDVTHTTREFADIHTRHSERTELPEVITLRMQATIARNEGRLTDAVVALEAAAALAPGMPDVLREIVELATSQRNFEMAATYLTRIAEALPAANRGDTYLELAEVCFEQLEDDVRGCDALKAAAAHFPAGARRDAALRWLSAEAATQLRWPLAVEALTEIAPSSRSGSDIEHLAEALTHVGRTADAVHVLGGDQPAAALGAKGPLLLANAQALVRRAQAQASALEQAAVALRGDAALAALREAAQLYRDGVGDSRAAARLEALVQERRNLGGATPLAGEPETIDEAELSDRVLQHALSSRHELSPLSQDELQAFTQSPDARARARAYAELARLARKQTRSDAQAVQYLRQAWAADRDFSEIWLPLADAMTAAGDLEFALTLYERAAASDEIPSLAKAWASDRAKALANPRQTIATTHAPTNDAARATAEVGVPAWQGSADEGTDGNGVPFAEGGPDEASHRITAVRTVEAFQSHPTVTRAMTLTNLAPIEALIAAGQFDQAEAQLTPLVQPADAAPHVLKLYVALLARRGDHARALPIWDQIVQRANEATLLDSLAGRAAAHLAADAGAARYATLKGEALRRPSDLAILHELKVLAAGLGNWDQVATVLHRLISIARTPEEKQRLHHELAEVLETHLHDHPGAARNRMQANRLAAPVATPHLLAETAAQARNAPPFQAMQLWLHAAGLAERDAQLADAQACYEHALTVAPQSALALEGRADFAYRQGDYEVADALYARLDIEQAQLPADELLHRRSEIAERLGRELEALEHAYNAATRAVTSRSHWQRVGQLAAQAGAWDSALEAARNALELTPLDDIDGYIALKLNIAAFLERQGEPQGAIAELEQLLQDHPQQEQALRALAGLYGVAGQWSAAARYLYQLVPLAPSSQARAEILHELGALLVDKLQDRDRADDVFMRAIDLLPTHVPTLTRLLDTYERLGDDQALAEVARELHGQGALIEALRNQPARQAQLALSLASPAPELTTALAEALGPAFAPALAAVLDSVAQEDVPAQLAKLRLAIQALARLAKQDKLDLAAVAVAARTPTVHTLLQQALA